MQQQTISQLSDLQLNGMIRAKRTMDADPTWIDRSFDEKFAYIVNQEHERRSNNRINRHIKEAGFKEQALLHDITFEPVRRLSRELVDRLATHQWIEKHENIILTGATGTGKSYLAQALGDHACRAGYRVQYYRVPDLVNALRFGKQIDGYAKLRRALNRRDVLILDDWGLAVLDTLSGHEIAEIVEDRLNKLSTIVVSQYDVGVWDKIFEDKTTADAVMDRLVHRAYPIRLEGPSKRQMNISDDLLAYKETMVE